MQVIFLPELWMIVSFFAVWFIIQMGSSLLACRIPETFLDKSGMFKQLRFESDAFYRKVFRVHRWKKLLPDGGAASKNGFRKKSLERMDEAYLEKFIIESKRAEAVHWLQIMPFWIFGFWSPPVVIPIMLVYALFVNMPCIIAQRYNRPRLQRVLDRLKKRG